MTSSGYETRLVGLSDEVSGSSTIRHPFGFSKSNALVRSPTTARLHGVMLVSTRSGCSSANRDSMNLMSDVWSQTCELTQPPLLHGEMTIIGTRIPSPYGPVGWPPPAE